MAKEQKRDNEYWEGRLEKAGRLDLLKEVRAKKITTYRARQLAGFLPEKPSSPAERLAYHWERSSMQERRRFISSRAAEIAPLLKEMIAAAKAKKAK